MSIKHVTKTFIYKGSSKVLIINNFYLTTFWTIHMSGMDMQLYWIMACCPLVVQDNKGSTNSASTMPYTFCPFKSALGNLSPPRLGL